MATVEQKRPKPTRIAERDPQVYHPLDRLRGIIRRYVVIEGALTAILFVALWFTLGLILDYGLFKVTGWDWAQDGARWVRGMVLVAAVALFVAILVFRIVRRLSTEFSYPALALVLERRFPKVLGDRLITAVEMADVEAMGKYGYSKDMLRATIAEARERVAKVPVQEVFNWRRLWTLGFLTVGVLLATLIFSFTAHAIATKSVAPYRFGWKFAHVTGIFLERNVALMNTPWPRRAHLELIGFPEGEMTVGRDAEPPQLKARAYRWVIADRSAHAGWRPLLWSDLTPEFVGRSVPELPASIAARSLGEGRLSVDSVERLAYDPGDESGATGAATSEAIKNEMNTRVEADPDNPGQTRTRATQDYEELQEVFKALLDKADQPSMGRTLRRLDVPDKVTYRYVGKQLAGFGDFTQLENNEFVGQIRDKNNKIPPETIQFIIRAADFVTQPRQIRPIPPPSLKRLGREQAEPAYLHHAPPHGEGYNILEGKLQKVAAKDLSLTGDRTVFVVPAGTEVKIIAEAYIADDGTISDTDQIVAANAIPVSGRFPGMVYDADGKPTQTKVPLDLLPNSAGFTITFKETEKLPDRRVKADNFLGSILDWAVAGRKRVTDFRITENVEFKVEYINRYNVNAERTFAIQALQDQAPTVEVALDVVRKVGPHYMVTANARIPFNLDSYIKDDRGLSRVEYAFEYWPEDSEFVRGLRTKYALRSLLDVPLPGAAPLWLSPPAHADHFRLLDKVENRQQGSVSVSEYNNQLSRLRRDTREHFLELLTIPKRDDEAPQTVPKITLNDPNRDYFDLKELQETPNPNEKPLLDIKPKAGDVQAIYRLDLIIQASDTNVDNDSGPRLTKNVEKITLRIVSESDLLNEIGKEEEVLAARLDEALVKLAAAKRKYEFVRNSNGYKEETPEQVDAVKVRAQDAMSDVDKARDIVQSVGRELHRLLRECRVNRLNDAALERYTTYAKAPDEILSEQSAVYAMTFPQTLTMLNAVQGPLNTSQWAPLAAVSDAENAIYALERDLASIRKMFGEARSLDKLKKDILRIKEQQARIRQEIEGWHRDTVLILQSPHPTYGPVGVLTFAKGETKKITQTISWNQYASDDIDVKFAVFDLNNDPAADALTVAPEMKLNFERHQFRFEYDVKAGNKPGRYKVRLTPAVGPPMEYQVIVE